MSEQYPSNEPMPPIDLLPVTSSHVRTPGEGIVLYSDASNSGRATFRSTTGTDAAMYGFVGGIQDIGKGIISWTQNTALSADVQLKYQPQEAGSVAWYQGSAEFSNPSGTRHNHAFSMGWNLYPGPTRAVGGAETAMGFGFEQHYNPDGNTYMEQHMYWVDASDAQHRPWSWLLNKGTGEVQGTYAANRLTFCLENGGIQTLVIQHSVTPATITLGRFNQQRVVLQNQYNNTEFIQQMNAGNSAYVEIARVDASDRVVIAGGGAPTKVGGNVGFNNTNPIAKPNITGSRGGNAALASLLTQLAAYGLITDGTSA